MVEQEVKNVLLNMGIAEKAISRQANFSKDLGLDSLDFMEMILELELRLEVHIPVLEAEELCTVQQAIEYLRKRVLF